MLPTAGWLPIGVVRPRTQQCAISNGVEVASKAESEAMKIRDLFAIQGRVSRTACVLTGIVLTLIKHNIERVPGMQIHQQRWGLMNNLTPLGMSNQPYSLSTEEKRFHSKWAAGRWGHSRVLFSGLS